MTLWIFGDSLSLPYDLNHPNQGWPSLLSNKLGTELKNFAEIAADNFFIYCCYLENKKHIKSDDLVVIGWSHPSRKSFVLDRNNFNHNNVINTSHVYATPTQEFIRNKNSKNIANNHWLPYLTPVPSGKEFYDTWFKNYYSEYEQTRNLQSFYDSVKYTCTSQCIMFFFNQESTTGITITETNFALDFITKHQLNINDTNMHFNQRGHQAWADYLYKKITQKDLTQ
jgi:hypothetical protein